MGPRISYYVVRDVGSHTVFGPFPSLKEAWEWAEVCMDGRLCVVEKLAF